MYKVLIVDDEKFIRKSIRNRVDWEKYGFLVEAEAGNGEEALKVMKELQPHMVLVDIRMPVMDGLAFISEAKKIFPKTTYVIMSAYSDFEYARKAIQIGVEDYVLKPIEEEEMEKILQKAALGLNKTTLLKQMEEADLEKSLFQENGNLVQAVAFWDIEEEYGCCMEEKLQRCSYIVENHLNVYYLEDYSIEHCFVYVLAGKTLSRKETRNMLREILDSEKTGIKASCSDIYSNREARKSTAEAVRILKRKMFMPETSLLSEEYTFGNEHQIYKEQKEKLIVAQKCFLKQEYEKAVQEFFYIIEYTVQKENFIENMEEMIRDILQMLSYYEKNREDQTDFNIMFHRFQSRDYLLLYENAEELKAALKNLLTGLIESAEASEGKETIEQIKDYIRENYAGNLNASEIAGKFYLNPSYFSTMFKEKTGMKLTNYIEGIRMEKAKEYLKNDIWTITEIALETGYSDSNYFSKVFKKYTGMSPKQFREKEQA